ncbi:MAG: hypothetical protein M1343_05450 [Chloroflexi bacterium]|nr:hypothetical protein [Chloroflexota bacterium]
MLRESRAGLKPCAKSTKSRWGWATPPSSPLERASLRQRARFPLRILSKMPRSFPLRDHFQYARLILQLRRGGRSGARGYNRISAVLRTVPPLFSFFLILAITLGLLAPVGPLVARAAEAPIPLTPGSGAVTTADEYPPLGVPDFSWSPVVGATRYRVQVSDKSDFRTTIVNDTTSNTRYTPAIRFPDGIWFWRVQVEPPSPPAGAYSKVMTFTKQWAGDTSVPALSSPGNRAVLDFYDAPTFSWQPVTGAASYKFQIALTSTGFSAPLYSRTTVATAHQPATKLANNTYHWRVVPVDPGGQEGMASEVRSFTVSYARVPSLLEPADIPTPTFIPTFRWTAVRGAEHYQLEYSTDPFFLDGLTSRVDTRNTTYTTDTIPINNPHYWHVRAVSGSSVGDWSQSRVFTAKWDTPLKLLTPVDGYRYVRDPFFSWTPVPGASYYRMEVNDDNSFPPGSKGFAVTTANPFYVKPDQSWTRSSIWYWRVTPVDASGNYGLPSDVHSFDYTTTVAAPELIYPLYYYTPTSTLQPHEDRTVALPVFTWHRLVTPTQVAAYRVQVAADPTFSGPIDWQFDTESLSAAPTATDPFTPMVGGVYYWRVRPLTALGGLETGQWSQVWETRIDTTRGLTATSGITPALLRPAHGSESVEATPLLEWWPLQGADSYDVQISADSSFATSIVAATVAYPAYAHPNLLGYGTYYWRVRGRSGGSPLGNWSAPWRFQVAAQSHWRASRNLGDRANQLPIASDAQGDTGDPNYDVWNLYAAQSKDFWFFGFNATITSTANVTYVLYLDLDHVDGSGATDDAEGYSVSAASAHQPEYAIYIPQNGGAFTATNSSIYHWNGSGWGSPQNLSVGGSLYYSPTANYVEIQVPNTVIGTQQDTGSVAVALFSALPSSGPAQDTVPDSGNLATTLTRFTSASDRMNLAIPPSNATGDPTTFPSALPFFWHWPVDTFWYGYEYQIATDSGFTELARPAHIVKFPLPSLAPPAYTITPFNTDIIGDSIYYWRVRPVYDSTGNEGGAWSQPGRFERQGFVPQNLQASISFATPTFSWDMVEGAESYDVQVDDDPNFASLNVSATVAQNSYTPVSALKKGTYYWRVRARRNGAIINAWTAPQSFTLTLPQPTGLTQYPSGTVGRAPTLCWTPLLSSSGGNLVLAAWKYRVQVSKGDPNFSASALVDNNVDTEQACWTPTKGYDDGTYYWHVAMIDGNNNVGDYSATAQFTKQYPVTTLVEPTNGATAGSTPTFVWTPVNGAAAYKLEVSQYPTFSPTYDSATTNNVRYTPTKSYATSKSYYWRVAMVDKDGKVGPYNNATLIVDMYPYKLYQPAIMRN